MSEKPADAPEACPGGPGSEMAGKASACEGCPSRNLCATAPKGPDPDIAAIAKCLQGNSIPRIPSNDFFQHIWDFNSA